MLSLVLIPTLNPTTLETLRCKTETLCNYGSLSDSNIKTNSYGWILPTLDLLYESLLLRQSNKVNMLALIIRKAMIVIISDLAKITNNPRTQRRITDHKG
jgi:hypothetical protein